MTREQAREATAVMLAWADGKEVEYKPKTNTSWTIPITNQEYNFDWNVFDYRIKPTKTMRPWTADEVPLGAWMRSKESNEPRFLITHTMKELFRTQWLSEYEHSLDGGKTWLPCGVEEDLVP